MSKYNINITPNLWYMVEEDKTYYFIEDNNSTIKKITDEQRSYIKETYNDCIDAAIFLYKEIISSRMVMEKKGFALCLSGFRKSSLYFPVTMLKNILNEPVQRVRDFETVIYIKDERRTGEVYSDFNGDHRFIHFSFDFRVLRRAINDKVTRQFNRTRRTDSELRDIYYDYYNIPFCFEPDNENCVNYMPLEKDLQFTKSKEYGLIIIPYTKKKYVQLKNIVDNFNKLGRAFFDFLHSDMEKLLPEIENIRKIK